MKKFSVKSIQMRIALWASFCLLISGVVIVAYTVNAFRTTAMEAAKQQALAEARTQAGIVKVNVEVGLDAARIRAQELAAFKQPGNPLLISREQVDAMMKQVLVDNPYYLGVWSLWEPNAFDGQDARYANTEGYNETGRPFPYWNRVTDSILIEPITGFDTGAWYQVPKNTKEEYVTDLFSYRMMSGEDIMMISAVAPIVVNGVFYGVAGEDFSVKFLQEIADRVNIYDGSGKLVLVDTSEKLLSVSGQPEWRGKMLSEFMPLNIEKKLAIVQAGEENIELNQSQLVAMVPIYFGKATKPWVALVVLPADKIIAPVNALMWQLLAISLVMLMVGVGALWFVARQIAHPIKFLTEIARKVAAGDLTQEIKDNIRNDELGVLTQDFNLMIKQLRFLYDTLEQRLAELTNTSQELQKSEKKYRDIYENAIEGIFQITLEGRVLSANPAAARILGYDSPDEALKNLIDVRNQIYINPEESDKVFASIFENGETSGQEIQLYRKDRQIIWAFVNMRLVRNEMGEPFFVEGLITDITLRKLAEKELRKYKDHLEELVKERTAELRIAKEQAEVASQAKSTFLSTMSHELRTPLNAIMGYAQFLKQGQQDGEVKKRLDIIQRSGEHLLILINDILDFAKIEAGKIELTPIPVSLPGFMENIISLIRYRADEKGLNFTSEYMDELPACVETDETRLRQILLNLLGNAVKFTNKGNVILRVRCQKYAQPISKPEDNLRFLLRFEVEDTGIGISPEAIQHIFLPFEQVGDTKYRAEGTGLGLAISRQLVHLMGGNLQVKSELGHGSLFWFEVALPEAKDIQTELSSEPAIIGYEGFRRRVLVVDDTFSSREVLIDMLNPLGFEIFQAVNGQQAVQLAGKVHPHLILMDRWMPVLDGVEAVKQMRQDPVLTRTPIICVSASVSSEDRFLSRKAGFDDFLSKPILWPFLMKSLEEHLNLTWQYQKDIEENKIDLQTQTILLVDDNEDDIFLEKLLLNPFGYQIETCMDGESAIRKFEVDPDRYLFVMTDYTMTSMNGLETARRLLKIKPSACVLLCSGYDDIELFHQAKEIGVRLTAQKPTTPEDMLLLLKKAGVIRDG